jgi:hypothetical protein
MYRENKESVKQQRLVENSITEDVLRKEQLDILHND